MKLNVYDADVYKKIEVTLIDIWISLIYSEYSSLITMGTLFLVQEHVLCLNDFEHHEDY